MSLANAQRAIVTNWVKLAREEAGEKARPHPPTPSKPKPPAAPAASCSASAQYSSHYSDYEVYVHSNQPDQTVTVTGAGTSASWNTDDSGYADVYLYAGRSAAGERVTVEVGRASCTATL